jgi:hypothetical protein
MEERLSPTQASLQQGSSRILGAALGASIGPAVAVGVHWSQLGPNVWTSWLLATGVGALLGVLTYGVFVSDEAAFEKPGVGFAALFTSTLGLLAGAFAGFPVGAIWGALTGLVAGAIGAVAWRRFGGLAMGGRGVMTCMVATGAAYVVAKVCV